MRKKWLLAAMVSLLCALAWTPAVAASNDEYFNRQWNLTQVGADRAWAVSTGTGITIGIVDTGADLGHPDLVGKIAANANCIGGTCREGGGQDTSGHGTLVSGVAAAVTGNGLGVASVAPGARLLVAKVLDGSAEGKPADIDAGIRWVVDRGARVVNLSLGDERFITTSAQGTPLRSAIEYAWSKGAVPVLASGNYNGGSGDIGSQNYGNLNALVVGATDRTGAVASYSSPPGNAKWGLVAPGGSGAPGADNNVISTYLGGSYVSAGGTSLAAPHVSGAVALLLATGMSPTSAVLQVLNNLDRISCGSGCQGRLNVARALGAPAAPPPTVAPAPSTTVVSAPAVAPSSTAPRRRATTTTAPVATTTSTSTSVPPVTTTVPVEVEVQDVAPPEPPVGLRALERVEPDPRGTSGPVAVAAALLLGVGGSVVVVSARRWLDAISAEAR